MREKNCSIDYWNGPGSVKNFTTVFRTDLFRMFASPESEILDMGCGYGRVCAELQRNGFSRICGTDVSEALIERGKKLYPGLELSARSRKELIRSERFDAVLLCAVLTAVPEDSEQENIVEECFRVLKPGGVLYCCDFLLNSDIRNLERYSFFAKQNAVKWGVFSPEPGAVLRHHTEKHIRELLKDFSSIPVFRREIWNTMNGHTSRGFTLVARKGRSNG